MTIAQDQLDTLIEIFSLILDLEEDEITTSLSAAETETWDSLALVSIVSAMESEFEINISNEEAIAIKTFKDAQELLQKLV